MKKNTRLILLAVLTLLMVGLLAVAASAATVDVYTDGETPAGEYDSFAALDEDISLEGIDPAAITRIVINGDTEIAATDSAINLSGLTLPVTIVGNGHTLTVNKDLTLPVDVTIENLNLYVSAKVNAGKKVTFDGGSMTSSNANGTGTRLFVVNDADAEIVGKNGFQVTVNKPSVEFLYLRRFKSVTFTDCAIETFGVAILMNDDIGNTGVLTLNNCTVNTICGRKDYKWIHCGNSSRYAQIVVNGGTYYGKWHTAGARITINSGTFESNEDLLLSLGDGDVAGQYVINGGDFLMSDKTRGQVKVFYAYGAAQTSNWAESNDDKAAIIIHDGTFTVLGNGSVIDSSLGGKYNIVIEGGTFTSKGGNQEHAMLFRFRNASVGTNFIVRGGTFNNNGGWRGLFNAAGMNMIISGGDFTSNGRIFGMHDSDGGAYTLTISGGTFKSTSGSLIFLDGKKASECAINISGGIFESTATSIIELCNASFGAQCKITGGTFNYNPTKAWDGYDVRGIISGSGATVTVEAVEGKDAPVFNTNACVFRLLDNDKVSPVIIKGGVFNATGDGRILSLSSPIARAMADGDEAKKGNVTIMGGTFSSENGVAVEFTTVYSCAVMTISGGDFTACKVPFRYCSEGTLTGMELITAGCKAALRTDMSTLTASGTDVAHGATFYRDLEVLWNDLDKQNEGEIALLVDQDFDIDLTGHNFYVVVSLNGHSVNPDLITGAVPGAGSGDEQVTLDCSKTVVKSAQVTLNDSIVVKIKARLAHGQTKLIVTIAGKQYVLDIADAVQSSVNSWRGSTKNGDFKEGQKAKELIAAEYTFTFEGLVPQCYDTNVTITDEAGTGSEIFNLKTYCEAVKAADESYTALVDALLVYGEAARQYVANEEVTAPEGFEAPTAGDVSKTEITGVVFKSARLNLADKVSLVFRVELTGELADYTVTVGGNAVTPVLVEGTTYDITVDLAASQLTGGITLSVVKGEETATLIYGVANYIVNMQSNTAIANFLKAIWLYGVAAAA